MEPSKSYDTSWTGDKDAVYRDYTNIYVANNVEDPIGDTIKLGYISNVDDVIFKFGEFSYFHFPLKDVGDGSNKFCDIEETSIIDDGATCGATPYASDRIYKMRFGYEDTSPYGKSEPETTSNGKWLCSWLSGDVLDPTVRPKWVDRWFDPKGISEQQALSLESGSKYVYDVDSILSFDYGVYYKYWRVGNETIRSIVDRIGIGGSLKVHHYNWVNDVTATDANSKVVYTNIDSTSLNNYRVSDDFEDGLYGITFNGKDQFAVIPYDDSIGHVTTNDYSIVFWVKCDSWKNSTSNSIVDNMYAGGWKFGVTNKADTMFVFAYGNDSTNELQDGTSCFLNQKGDLISTKAYWKIYDDPELREMVMDIDGFAYMLDWNEREQKTTIHKIDYYGNELGSVAIPDNLEYIDISSFDSGMYLLAYSTSVCYKINRNYLTYQIIDDNLVSLPHDGAISIKVDGTHQEYFCYDHSKCVITDNGDNTNDGNPLSGKFKYYTKDYFQQLLGIDDDDPEKDDIISMTVDYDNNIWLLRSQSIEKFSEIYHTYRYSKSYKIKKGIDPTCIDILAKNDNGVNEDVLILPSSKKHCVYSYSTEGEYIGSYDTSKFYVRPANKRRCTSYDWYRMNKGITNCVYFDMVDGNGHNRIVKEIDECSDSEWHQMAATVGKDGDKWYARFYFDCQLVGQKEITKVRENVTTNYRYDSPIVLGGVCGKLHPIVQEINVTNCSFACTIDDFRIYNTVLKPVDFYYIYIMKYTCGDLVWHLRGDDKNFVENLERFYKFKMPGSKSAQYVLHIKGYSNEDGTVNEEVKEMIEDTINRAFKKLTPAYTSLFKIVWD